MAKAERHEVCWGFHFILQTLKPFVTKARDCLLSVHPNETRNPRQWAKLLFL